MAYTGPFNRAPSYDVKSLVETWLRHSDSYDQAMNVDRFARYVPELGWPSIVAVSHVPGARAHLGVLATPLGMLISQYGPTFIDRIELEAARNPVFRECLGHVHPDPVFPIPESLWERLATAAGKPVGSMAPHMAALHADMPDLAEMLAWDPVPLASGDAPSLGATELRAQAEDWVTHHGSFWAWEELHRILAEDGPAATWPIVLTLIENASERALAPVGAGILEALLGQNGPDVIERVEARAAADPRFRFCLSHAWQGDMSDEIWARVEVARGDEPQRG